MAKRGETLRAAETAFESARVEVDRLRKALDDQRAARDQAMETLKGELVVAGQGMARLREKSQARGTVRRETDDIDRTLRGTEREFDDLRAATPGAWRGGAAGGGGAQPLRPTGRFGPVGDGPRRR